MKEYHFDSLHLIETTPVHSLEAGSYSEERALRAMAFHRSIPGYKETPLVSLSCAADQFHVDSLFVKDESHRFGLKAFKGLGGSYCLFRVLCERFGLNQEEADYQTFQQEDLRAECRKIHVATATDGNHGKGVSWAAGLFGCRAHVFMPAGSVEARRKADAVGKTYTLIVSSKATKTTNKGVVPLAKASCKISIKPSVSAIWFGNISKMQTADNNTGEKQLAVGKSFTFTPSFTIMGKGSAVSKALVWESSDPKLAVVDKNGKVKALQAGKLPAAKRQVTITAYSEDDRAPLLVSDTARESAFEMTDEDGVTYGINEKGVPFASFTFTVYTPISGLTIDKTKYTLETRDGYQYGLIAVNRLLPEDATDERILWTVSNDNLELAEAGPYAELETLQYKACVEQSKQILGSLTTQAGNYPAIKAVKPGTAVITGRSMDRSGKTVKCTVTIKGHVTGLSLKEGNGLQKVQGQTDLYSVSLKPGASLQLSPNLEINNVSDPGNTGTAANKALAATYNSYKKYTDLHVNYYSTDPENVLVSASGKIRVSRNAAPGTKVLIYTADITGACGVKTEVTVVQ